MQLAQSSTLPTDSNLLSLMLPGATLSAGPTPTNWPCGVVFEGGFDTLLPESANASVASVGPAAESPIDLWGGVPLEFMPGADTGVGNEFSLRKPGLTLPLPNLEDGEPAEGDASANAGQPVPRASHRSARLTPRSFGPEFGLDIPVDPIPERLANAVAVTQVGFVPVTPNETALLEDELVMEAPVETPAEEEGADVETFAQRDTSAWSSSGARADNPTRPWDFKRLPADAGESQPAPMFEPRHPIALAMPRGTQLAEMSEPLRSEPSLTVTNLADENPTAPAQSWVTIEEQAAVGVAIADTGLDRVINLPRRGWEKTAATSLPEDSEHSEQDNASEKSFVTHEAEMVTPRRRWAGTEVAKPEPTMPASTFSSPTQQLKNEAASSMVAATSGLAERVESHNVLALALDGVSSAHEAVEVVLRTADRLSSLVHKSVRLEFAVGGEKLDVRVELRANEVRTTFHTESAELRTALASEWQSVTASAGQGERTLRILPAQFGSSEQNAANSFSGDASSRHREPQQQAQSEASQVFGSGVRGRSGRGSRAAVEAPALDTSFAAPGTALHLHTLA